MSTPTPNSIRIAVSVNSTLSLADKQHVEANSAVIQKLLKYYEARIATLEAQVAGLMG